MKFRFLIIIFIFSSISVLCQNVQLLAKNEEIAKERVANPKVISTLKNKYIIPLFGQQPKSKEEQESDQSFIKMCKENFGDLKEASIFFSDRGWDYVQESELDTAIHRFNLSYLLNPKNTEIYWGLGVVHFKQDDFCEAIKYLKMGTDIDSSNTALWQDLGMAELAHYEKNKDKETIKAAEKHLKTAVETDASNIQAWLKLAESEYILGNYYEAWQAVHSVKLLDENEIDQVFVKKLLAKRDDPKDFYHK